jgi:tetratricopeptide (TPR) repeat protein
MRKYGTFLVVSALLASHITAQNPKKSLSIAFPNASWEVQVDFGGFAIKLDETKPDGKRYLFASNDRTGIELSVTLERVRGIATLADCKSTLNQRVERPGALKPSNVKTSTSKDFVILEYVLHEVDGMPVEQKNIFACAAKGDAYVDLHFSKVLYSPRDDEVFTALLNSVYIVDHVEAGASSGVSSSLDYWLKGSTLFRDGEYAKAIDPYQKALDLEKKARQLSPDYWRVLIDNLGMAYGITGKPDSAEEVLRYGIANAPTYPMFYYNLACVYAERGDMDKTMDSLSTAFKYRANVIAGEKMPDPKSDDSFQQFMKNEKFRRLMDSF